jgi:thiamine biosynthesis lipoprotein
MSKFKRFTLNGPTMGTRYAAVFHAPVDFDERALALELQGAVDAVDQQMSTWKPGSDLNLINAAPLGRWVHVPSQLMTVLQAALAINHQSNGAFDIGVGHQVARWGFGAQALQPSPILTERQDVPRRNTEEALMLDPFNNRAKRLAEQSFDLSGIAKGFGVDELGRVLNASGIKNWLVGIDGEMRSRGQKPDGTAWAVGHERPVAGRRDVMGVIELTDRAVATSGNYRHFRDEGGHRLSHTIDPRHGKPVANDVASVTVLAPTCMLADAWATALIVKGEHDALATARLHGLEAVMVRTDQSVAATL